MATEIRPEGSTGEGTVDSPWYPDVCVETVGQDVNAFRIIGRVSQELRNAGVPNWEIKRFTGEAMSGDYDNLLRTVMRWVEVW